MTNDKPRTINHFRNQVATAPGSNMSRQKSRNPVAIAPGSDMSRQKSRNPVATAPGSDMSVWT